MGYHFSKCMIYDTVPFYSLHLHYTLSVSESLVTTLTVSHVCLIFFPINRNIWEMVCHMFDKKMQCVMSIKLCYNKAYCNCADSLMQTVLIYFQIYGLPSWLPERSILFVSCAPDYLLVNGLYCHSYHEEPNLTTKLIPDYNGGITVNHYQPNAPSVS